MLDGDAAACGLCNRRLACLHGAISTAQEMIVTAAQPRYVNFGRTAARPARFSLEDERSCHETATLPEECGRAESIARVGATAHGRQGREFAIFEVYLALA